MLLNTTSSNETMTDARPALSPRLDIMKGATVRADFMARSTRKSRNTLAGRISERSYTARGGPTTSMSCALNSCRSSSSVGRVVNFVVIDDPIAIEENYVRRVRIDLER